MKVRQTIAASAIALAIAGVNGAYASPITYAFDQIIGPGSVTGTLTTDGTIGTLSAADIVSFDLTLNDGTSTANLSSPAFVIVNANACCSGGTPNGVDLTASLTNLMFNYSGVDGGDFGLQGLSPNFDGQLCYTATSNCWGPTGVGLYDVGHDGKSVYIAQSGNQIIATAVPEPSTLALFGAGLAGLSVFCRRRKQALAAS